MRPCLVPCDSKQPLVVFDFLRSFLRKGSGKSFSYPDIRETEVQNTEVLTLSYLDITKSSGLDTIETKSSDSLDYIITLL